MKYALIIWVCSFATNECAAPIQKSILYKDWNECVVAAYNYSITFLTQQSIDDINYIKLATKFVCKEIDSV